MIYFTQKCCLAWLLVWLYRNNYHYVFKKLIKRIAGLISKLKGSNLIHVHVKHFIIGHQMDSL